MAMVLETQSETKAIAVFVKLLLRITGMMRWWLIFRQHTPTRLPVTSRCSFTIEPIGNGGDVATILGPLVRSAREHVQLYV
jgi:hypothetical protein